MITIETNNQNSINTATTTTELPIFTTGDEFWTKGNTTLKNFIINEQGDATTKLCISFADIPDDTSIKDFSFAKETDFQKILYRIILINSDDEAIVEISLKNGETQKKLNKYYSSILKSKNLFFKGSEFYVVYEKIQDGLNIHIEPYSPGIIKNTVYDCLYKELVN